VRLADRILETVGISQQTVERVSAGRSSVYHLTNIDE
jgi:hypothetical protein